MALYDRPRNLLLRDRPTQKRLSVCTPDSLVSETYATFLRGIQNQTIGAVEAGQASTAAVVVGAHLRHRRFATYQLNSDVVAMPDVVRWWDMSEKQGEERRHLTSGHGQHLLFPSDE